MCPSEFGVQDLPQQWYPITVVTLSPGGDNLSYKSFTGSKFSSCSSFPLSHASMKQIFLRQIMQVNPSEKSTFGNICKYKFTEFFLWCVQGCGLNALSKCCKYIYLYINLYIYIQTILLHIFLLLLRNLEWFYGLYCLYVAHF